MSKAANSPLVTVAVMTYNSARFVIETLESVKAQTYPNIALIVSDDASQDNTIGIVREWISLTSNRERFKGFELVTVPINKGIAANCNRALAAAESDWVKFIAGDDILLPNCIDDNMKFHAGNPEALAIFSQLKVYENTFDEKNFIKYTPSEFPNNLMHPGFTAEDQYKLLWYSDRITYTPSFFLNKQIILNAGGYDETEHLVEDYPMWLKLTKSGYRLFYFHEPTVGYRVHPEAINNVGDQFLFKPSEINNFAIRRKYAHPHLPWIIGASETWKYRVSIVFKHLGWTRKNAFLNCLYSLWTIYLNPFVYLQTLQKRIFNK